MKKFFAVVLGLALVLGLASVASAEFTASGKLTMTWVVDTDNDTDTFQSNGMVDDSNFALKLSNTWDNASASLTIKYDLDAVEDPLVDEKGFVVDGYEFAYVFSDQFTFKAAKSFEVKTPIFETAANIDSPLAFIGEFTLDGGWVKAATNLDLDTDATDLALGAEFAFDPVTVGGVVDINGGEDATPFGLYVKYALTDEITLTGDVLVADENQDLAIKAEYSADPFTAAATIKYDIDGEAGLYEYKVEGSYAATETLTLSANYKGFGDDTLDPEYEVKAALTINEGPVFSVSYNQNKDLTAKIEASF